MTREAFVEANNVQVRVRDDIPHRIRGFCTLDYDGVYTIFLNGKLSVIQQRKTLDHELDHIMRGECESVEYIEYAD